MRHEDGMVCIVRRNLKFMKELREMMQYEKEDKRQRERNYYYYNKKGKKVEVDPF